MAAAKDRQPGKETNRITETRIKHPHKEIDHLADDGPIDVRPPETRRGVLCGMPLRKRLNG